MPDAADLSYIPQPIRHLARPIDELTLDPANVRKHSDRNIAEIQASLKKYGQRRLAVVRKEDMTIEAGNGMTQAALNLGWTHVACLVVDDDELTAMKYAIADNRTAELAEWDTEGLTKLLDHIAASEEGLEGTGFDDDEFDTLWSLVGADDYDGEGVDDLLDREEDEGLNDGKYTQEISTPVYEITGREPAISDLFDATRTKELIRNIEAADLPAELAEFLKFAAYRHTEFSFSQIAEYYAHADTEVQELMEQSALVIVDFDRAIEEGFVKMTSRLAELVGSLKAEGDEEDE